MAQRYIVDTSALIARLLAKAAGHSWMESICDLRSGNTIVIAEVTEAEIAAALNQLVRGGVIKQKRCEQSLALFWSQVDAGEYHVISVTTSIVRRAADLCASHPLKGYDAVQLACALAFRDAVSVPSAANPTGGVPQGDPIFLTEDQRLAAAASAEGFAVDSPAAHP